LLKPLVEKGVPLFMQKVATGYSMYFNKKNERSGTLIQGKFKSRWIDTDVYFRRVLNYIHANPAELYEPRWKWGNIKDEKELKKKLRAYQFSSLSFYLDGKESPILNKEAITDMLERLPVLDDLLEEHGVVRHDAARLAQKSGQWVVEAADGRAFEAPQLLLAAG